GCSPGLLAWTCLCTRVTKQVLLSNTHCCFVPPGPLHYRQRCFLSPTLYIPALPAWKLTSLVGSKRHLRRTSTER
ncbi:hypothetical protein BD777DRAFT_131220, partial [Yarrowia lipolytica]